MTYELPDNAQVYVRRDFCIYNDVHYYRSGKEQVSIKHENETIILYGNKFHNGFIQ